MDSLKKFSKDKLPDECDVSISLVKKGYLHAINVWNTLK